MRTTQSEMQRLIDVLAGRWTCRASYEPNPEMPEGGSSVGWEQCRVGPGGSSILFDTRARGAGGDFAGAGVITWDSADNCYALQWLSTSSPEPGHFTGRWSNGNVVFDGREFIGASSFASRHSITEISADSFVYTVDLGSAPGELRRAMTIRYAREE